MYKEFNMTEDTQLGLDKNAISQGGVSVIMVIYFSGECLFKAIETALSEPLVAELVLVDNGSTPQDSQRLHSLKAINPRVKLIQDQGNIGFGRAVNLGASLAMSPWLIVLNPDAFIQNNCVKLLRDAAFGQASPCIVGARLLNQDLSEQRGSRRGEVSPVTALISLLQLDRILPFLKSYELHLHDQPLPDKVIKMPTISGACFLISAHDFKIMGGFDPVFFLHVEDIELCWRARKMGGVVLFHPFAEVIHIGHTSLAAPIFVERHKANGLIYFFNKRANTLWRKTYLFFLAPLIVLASRLRVIMRRFK